MSRGATVGVRLRLSLSSQHFVRFKPKMAASNDKVPPVNLIEALNRDKVLPKGKNIAFNGKESAYSRSTINFCKLQGMR